MVNMWCRWVLIGIISLLLHLSNSDSAQESFVQQKDESEVTNQFQSNVTLSYIKEGEEESLQLRDLEPTTANVSFFDEGMEGENMGVCAKEPVVFPWLPNREKQTPAKYEQTFHPLDVAGSESAELQRPRCEEGKGCDRPLNCFDFRKLGNDSIVPDPPNVVKVTPYELEEILENASIQNCCAIVMFYAQWCEFSAQFGRKFNALGRTFAGLPVLAVDLGENEPHKYILAYLPVVAFYYRGRVILKFRLSASYKDLKEDIANMTGFTPRHVDLMDEANAHPVPIERVDGDRYALLFASWWLVFVGLVSVLKSSPFLDCIRRLWQKTQ